MMNLQNRHDAQLGFVQFIIPAQQWSKSLVSHRSSQDSLPRPHRYIYLQIDRGPNLQDSPTTKVEIIRNRLLKLVASTLVIIQEVDSHISNPWSHAQPTHVVHGCGTKDSIFQNFHALSQSLDPTFLYSNSIFLLLVLLIIATKHHQVPYTWYRCRCWVYRGHPLMYNISTSLQQTFFDSGFICYDHPCSFLLPQRLKLL